ncbi:19504_t:CDS:1 [Dentiscutata erythropus]|uniref:19504_t:CDS:1 n=1 Tax=Dentiscutata erythropus TaxID=1348616 RepID=A0A9N9NSR8_9GLOM|nr:19504_t:CDS:1 [Dentiscutata erythropus]
MYTIIYMIIFFILGEHLTITNAQTYDNNTVSSEYSEGQDISLMEIIRSGNFNFWEYWQHNVAEGLIIITAIWSYFITLCCTCVNRSLKLGKLIFSLSNAILGCSTTILLLSHIHNSDKVFFDVCISANIIIFLVTFAVVYLILNDEREVLALSLITAPAIVTLVGVHPDKEKDKTTLSFFWYLMVTSDNINIMM